MVKNKYFYKFYFILTISIALQNLLTFSVNLADNVMLGRYSEVSMAGVALCNQIQFFLQMLVDGVGVSVVVMGSQYWGKKNLEPIPHIIGVALRFGLMMSSVIFFMVFLFPRQVLLVFTNNEAVISEGVSYLRIVCFTYLIFSVSNMLAASLRSIGIVKVGYMISASTLCINIILNSLLIYGMGPFPELGIRGAAIATLVSRSVELLIIIWFLKFKEKQLNITLSKLIHIDRSYYKDYVNVALPTLITQGLWGFAQMIQTAILGHLGMNVIAANSIAIIVVQIITVVVYGSAGAAAIITGKSVGEGDVKVIKENTRTFQVLFLILGVITSGIILLVIEPVLSIYVISEEAKEMARRFMIVLAITTLGTSYQMSSDAGIIRGGGDTKFPMYNNNFFMWVIVIPSALISAFVFNASPVVIFFCLKSDQLLKCPVIAWRVNSFRWIKKVTRTC